MSSSWRPPRQREATRTRRMRWRMQSRSRTGTRGRVLLACALEGAVAERAHVRSNIQRVLNGEEPEEDELEAEEEEVEDASNPIMAAAQKVAFAAAWHNLSDVCHGVCTRRPGLASHQ